MGAVAIVAVAAIVLVGVNIGGYYAAFTRPTLALLNSSGLAENYPFQISNATPVNFELELLKPLSNTAHYSLIVYISNGTDSIAEQSGPIGDILTVISLPSTPGNITLPVSFTLFYTGSAGSLEAYRAVINGEPQSLSVTLPHGVVGLFFELASSGGQIKPIPYAWVALWLNVEVAK